MASISDIQKIINGVDLEIADHKEAISELLGYRVRLDESEKERKKRAVEKKADNEVQKTQE